MADRRISRTDWFAMANAGVRFLSEIAAVVAIGYWGYRSGHDQLITYGLGIGLPRSNPQFDCSQA